MSTIDNARSGMRIRLARDWVITRDPLPAAYSAVMCPHCEQGFSGTGTSLATSMAAAEAKMAEHRCPAAYRMEST